MSLSQRSPRSRKSLSRVSENEPPQFRLAGRPKGRAASVGGVEVFGQPAPKVALSPRKVARRSLAPRKSILKGANQDDTTSWGMDAEDDDTQFMSMGTDSTTMRIKRGVKFAAHAHVRMFETDLNQLSQSQAAQHAAAQAASAPVPTPRSVPTPASAIALAPAPVSSSSGARRSSTGHARRASVQNADAFSVAAPALVIESRSVRRSSAVSEGSVEMDLESDEEDDAPFRGQLAFDLPPTPQVFSGSTPTSPFVFGGALAPTSSAQDDESGSEDMEEDDVGMDETQAVGGILASATPSQTNVLVHPSFSPSASTQSAHSDDEDAPGANEDEDDKTMDFTVATGGLIPTAAPAVAEKNVRRSIGYAIDDDAAQRISAWSRSGSTQGAAPQPEVSWDDSDAGSDAMDLTTRSDMTDMTRATGGIIGSEPSDGDEMDFTRVQGGIVSSHSAPPSASHEVNVEDDDMDMTRATGGILAGASRVPVDDDSTEGSDRPGDMSMDMEQTMDYGGVIQDGGHEHSGIVDAETDTSSEAIDFTVAGGGIFTVPAASSSSAPVPPKSPRRTSTAPTPTRPLQSSLSRPTASSAAKTKNIFEASPAKPLAPVISQGRQAPGSARKLIFGQASASPGKKRSADDDLFSSKSPKRRSSVVQREDDVFGSGRSQENGKEREKPATVNIFAAFQVEEVIVHAPENPPSPEKSLSAPSEPVILPPRSPSPVKPIRSVFDLGSAHPTSTPALFSTSPKVAPPPEVVRRHSSPFTTVEESVAAPEQEVVAVVAKESTVRKLGRPSISDPPYRRQSRAAEQEPASVPDVVHEPSPVSVSQFLEMTGVTFLDKMHPRRRSTIRPGEMTSLYRAGLGRSTTDREYQLAEYAHYLINLPKLTVYLWACENLRSATASSQGHVVQLDREFSEHNPLLFREYLEAEDVERGMIEAQLKYLKVYAHLTTKKRWYQWRAETIETLKTSHTQDLAKFQEDHVKIEILSAAFKQETSLADLRARREALKLQLEQERAQVARVLACDQEALGHRRAEITEQKEQLDALKADLADTNVMLGSLTIKRDALEAQRSASQAAIDRANAVWNDTQGFTQEKVFALKNEYDTIEHLHGVKITSLRADYLELVVTGDLRLVIPCCKFEPSPVGAYVELVKDAKARRNPLLVGHLFELVQSFVADFKAVTVQQLVQDVIHVWRASTKLALELHLVSLRYPISYSRTSSPSVAAAVTILLPALKSKIRVTFDLHLVSSLRRWPATLKDVPVGVKTVYGPVDATSVESAIQGRLAEATPDAHFGTFIEACLAAL